MYYHIITDKMQNKPSSIFTASTGLGRLTNSLLLTTFICHTLAFIHLFPEHSIKSWNNLTDAIVHLANKNLIKKKLSLLFDV